MNVPLPEDEVARLENLRSYQVLDTPPEQAFDDLTRLAAYICGAPIALLGFIDVERHWFKSRIGWDVPEVPRDMSFCAHTILQSDVLVVSDTIEDHGRLATCVLATHGGIRFYAGVPLISSEGHALGTLCVMDSVPRGLTDGQVEALRKLARQVMAQLESGWRPAPEESETPALEIALAGNSLPACDLLYRTIVETASDAMVVFDDNNKILLANPAAEKMFGYTNDALLGQPLTTLIPEGLQDAKNEAKTGKGYLAGDSGEVAGLRKSGDEIWLQVSLAGSSRDGERIFVGICRDTTEHRAAVESAIACEARYRSLFENAAHGVFRMAANGKWLEVNPALIALLGYNSAEEVLRLNSSDIYVDQKQSLLAEKWLQTKQVDEEVHWKSRDGAVITLRLRGQLLNTGRGIPESFEIVAEDVTERQSLQGQLRQAQKIEGLGQMAGGIAHEFNNFLGVILGYTELLLEDAGENESLRRKVSEIKTATQRASSVTRQLLTFGRKQVLEPKVLDINQAIWETHKLLRRMMPANIDIIPVLAHTIGLIKVDPGQIQQILINLVANARDAMPQGGKVIIETVDLELDEQSIGLSEGLCPGRYVLLSIRDTGGGMDAETRSHLFEPFFTTKQAGKGTGLGLSTIYGIVKQNSGHITVDSDLGKGTIFRIYLPEVPAKGEEAGVATTAEAGSAGGEAILLVEDEAAFRRLLCLSLERRGYKVLAAKDGGEAIDILRQDPGEIHLVVSDIMMPRLDGVELKRRIASLNPNIKFLFMSGYSDEIIEQRRIALQGCAFLEKPFLPDELADKVRTLLKGATPGRRVSSSLR